MIPLPANVRVWPATGHTDMRKGFFSLGLIIQETLMRDPQGGHLFVFRGRRGDLIKSAEPRRVFRRPFGLGQAAKAWTLA